MKVIIIEDKAYSVPNKMVKILQDKMAEFRSYSIKDSDYKISNILEMELHDFLQKNIPNWKCLGYIHFDFRL